MIKKSVNNAAGEKSSIYTRYYVENCYANFKLFYTNWELYQNTSETVRTFSNQCGVKAKSRDALCNEESEQDKSHTLCRTYV